MKSFLKTKLTNRIISALFLILMAVTIGLIIFEVFSFVRFVQSFDAPEVAEVGEAYARKDTRRIDEINERIKRNGGFYLVLNQGGEIIASCNLPWKLDHVFSDKEIKKILSSNDLNSYKVESFYNEANGEITIQGDSFLDVLALSALLGVGMALPFVIVVIGVSFLLLLALLYLNHQRFKKLEKSLEPILGAITELENGKEALLPEEGLLADVNTAVNHLSDIISVREKNRTEWISGVTHDIKNPLIMINESSERILDEPEAAEEISDKITANVLKIKTLVDSLNLRDKLYYSLIPANLSKTSLVGLIMESTVEFMNANETDSYPIGFDFDPLLETVEVEVDIKLMDRLISNLLLNSVNNNPDGTELSLRLQQRQDCYELTVSDKGIGVSPATLEKLNMISELKDYSGSGLGILIAKKIAQIHGMNLRFESELGRGFTNVLEIPIQ